MQATTMNNQYQSMEDMLGQGDWLLPDLTDCLSTNIPGIALEALHPGQNLRVKQNLEFSGDPLKNHFWETAPQVHPPSWHSNDVTGSDGSLVPTMSNGGFGYPFQALSEVTSATGPQFFLNGGEVNEGPVNNGFPQILEVPDNSPRRPFYPKIDCATCAAPLDLSEQLLHVENPGIYCTINSTSTHCPLVCQHAGCEVKFMNLTELAIHATAERHLSLYCTVPGCVNPELGYGKAYDGYHYQIAHRELKYECAQCGLLFNTTVLLDEHGRGTMHNAYACQYPGCKSESTRFNDLIRHQLTHKKNGPRHSCPHCHTYRGNNGFRRKDHLRQHIRNYHHIDESGLYRFCLLCITFFFTLDKLTDHMRHQHNSLPFFCPHKLCDRVGMNGFETERLMKAHLKKYHPSKFQCSEPGCDRVGTKGWMRKRDMVKHMKNAHGVII